MLGFFISLIMDVLLKSQLHLKKIQETMVASAHQAGMAEIATGILHNVGNILNSINVGAEKIHGLTGEGKLETFGKLNCLIKENRSSWGDFFLTDPKGSKVFDLYFHLKEVLAADFETLKQESVAPGFRKDVASVNKLRVA